MRHPLIAANWKMHLGRTGEALALVRRIRHPLSNIEGLEVVLCPPFTVLPLLAEVLAASPIRLGAQNMHWSEEGAHTGEISPAMLTDLCDYVILGHSERRATGGSAEDDRAINRKVQAAVDAGLRPIICVGESLGQREANATADVLRAQVSAAVDGLGPEEVACCVIAYEPIWAIGSGRPATPPEANRILALHVRGAIAESFGEDVAQSVRMLYGGSVDEANIASFLAMPEVEGALVGGASLGPGFVELARRAARA